MNNEARITINGVTLNPAESMTLRVAVTSFQMDIEHNGLGDDEMGKALSSSYIKNCQTIIDKIFNGIM